MTTLTDIFGRVMLAVTVLVVLLAAARAAFGGPAPSVVSVITPTEAIERAIAQRIGGRVSVEVTALQTAVAPERALRALPDPGGRPGEPMRFVMLAGRIRRGIAVATVKVLGTYARAARPLTRNEKIAADAVDIVEGELPASGFKRLPATADVVGLIARRDIAAGEPLTQAVVKVPLAVQSGDEVVLTVVAGTVRVTTKALASSSGYEGDTIRVVPENGRPLKARVTGRGTVEVIQ
jgi:flagella basal body P-ring formation protein FlgA